MLQFIYGIQLSIYLFIFYIEIATADIVSFIQLLQQNSENQNVKNLAAIFLEEASLGKN